MTVAPSEDKEVGEADFGVVDFSEVRTDGKGVAEGFPLSKGGIPGLVRLVGVDCLGALQSSAEMISEELAGGRCSSCQPPICG